MKKPVIAFIVSAFAVAAGHSIAATPLKLEPLTTEQRADMHQRADSLLAIRAANPAQTRATPKATAKTRKMPAL